MNYREFVYQCAIKTATKDGNQLLVEALEQMTAEQFGQVYEMLQEAATNSQYVKMKTLMDGSTLLDGTPSYPISKAA